MIPGREAVVLALAALCGCARVVRLGPPTALPAQEPRNACERQGWVELVPAEVRPFGEVTTYEGTGIFRLQARKPEELDDLFPRMQEPELQLLHDRRVRSVDAAARRSLYWFGAGTAGFLVGLGGAIALQHDHHQTAGTVAGISALVMLAVGAVGGILTMPSPQALSAADARHLLFMDGEDDMKTVERGVDRLNQSTRQGCAAPAAAP